MTIDNSDAEKYETIYTIAESPKNGEVIWAGTDDGNVQITRDGGKHWTNVVTNVPGLPAEHMGLNHRGQPFRSRRLPTPHSTATRPAT